MVALVGGESRQDHQARRGTPHVPDGGRLRGRREGEENGKYPDGARPAPCLPSVTSVHAPTVPLRGASRGARCPARSRPAVSRPPRVHLPVGAPAGGPVAPPR